MTRTYGLKPEGDCEHRLHVLSVWSELSSEGLSFAVMESVDFNLNKAESYTGRSVSSNSPFSQVDLLSSTIILMIEIEPLIRFFTFNKWSVPVNGRDSTKPPPSAVNQNVTAVIQLWAVTFPPEDEFVLLLFIRRAWTCPWWCSGKEAGVLPQVCGLSLIRAKLELMVSLCRVERQWGKCVISKESTERKRSGKYRETEVERHIRVKSDQSTQVTS